MRQAAMQSHTVAVREHDAEESAGKGKNPAFIGNMRRDIYAKGEISMEEKIKRNAHYNQALRSIKDHDE